MKRSTRRLPPIHPASTRRGPTSAPTTYNLQPTTSPTGFTTLEVLVALGIFAFGFLAIAAIFPVGLLMQKQTTNSILAGHVADNGIAIMQARTLEQADMNNTTAGTGTDDYYDDSIGPAGGYPPQLPALTLPAVENRVKPLQWNVPARTGPPAVAAGILIDRFGAGENIGDRSYPSTIQTFADREFFWVPLVQDPDGEPNPTADDWIFYICIMQREPGIDYSVAKNVANAFYADNTDSNSTPPNNDGVDTYPTMRYVPVTPADITGSNVTFPFTLGLIVGDLILDSEGIQYTVLAVNGDTLTLSSVVTSEPEWFWYAPPGTGTGSPLVRIKKVLITLD
ncbi:MAG: hypothetical protein AAF797_13470 [Planctomycetota bacterium]